MKTWYAPEVEELNVLETKCGGEEIYGGFGDKGQGGNCIPPEHGGTSNGGCNPSSGHGRFPF